MGPNGLRQIGNYLGLSAGHLDLDESETEQYYLTIDNKLIQDGETIKLELKLIKEIPHIYTSHICHKVGSEIHKINTSHIYL